jgi:hypothetical protein
MPAGLSFDDCAVSERINSHFQGMSPAQQRAKFCKERFKFKEKGHFCIAENIFDFVELVWIDAPRKVVLKSCPPAPRLPMMCQTIFSSVVGLGRTYSARNTAVLILSSPPRLLQA